MTIARRGTNFNWQLRMLKSASEACGNGGCPAPCLIITDPDQIPADASNCPSGLIAIAYPVATDYIIWNGSIWVALAEISTLTSTGAQGTLSTGWEISINLVWYTKAEWEAGVTFSDPISIATFTYRTITGCILEGRTVEISADIYHYFAIQDPISGNNQFLDWTINGESFYFNQSVMQSFGGDAFYFIITSSGNPSGAYLWYKGSTEPVITLLDETGTPVPITWTPVPSTLCYDSADVFFDVTAAAQYLFTNLPFSIDINASISGDPINDPAFEAAMDAWAKVMFGPQASFTIQVVGSDVTSSFVDVYLEISQITVFGVGNVFTYAPAVCPP